MLNVAFVSTAPRVAAGLGWLSRIARSVAWGALVAVTGLLVRAEAHRSELPEGVDSHTDIVYRRVADRTVTLDVYTPTAPVPPGGRPVVLAIHGGGWRGGSKNGYGREVASLAQHGYVVVSVAYQLSKPGAPSWPGNFEDVREAVRWVRRHAADYGVDPNRIVAMGASAGGHLAALLGTYPDGQVCAEGFPSEPAAPHVERCSARVQAVVDFYGPSDLCMSSKRGSDGTGQVELMLGGTPGQFWGRYKAASPVRHVSGDDAPMLLLHGSADRFVAPGQSEALARALREVGVAHRLILIEGAGHGFGFQVGGRDFVPEILDFLDAVWNHKERDFRKFGLGSP